jgi:tetratricopeptide (TPR) repeat protein
MSASSVPLEDPTAALERARGAVDATPDDIDALRDAAEILVSEGEDERATRTLQRIVEIAPDDIAALVDLAHLQHRGGRSGAAIELLDRAVESDPGNVGLLRNLVDLHVGMGRPESALARAEELAKADPSDVIVLLDIAEIAMGMGDYVKASHTFDRLGRVDDVDGHRVYAYHGVIEAEVLAERWRLALNAAIDATAVDRHEFTTDLLLFVSAQVFGATTEEREPKPWAELSAQLAQERAAHRRFHTEQDIL